MSLVGAGAMIGFAYFFRFNFMALQQAKHYPTAIPWLESEAECQETGRYWQEEACWDREHDANF